VYVSRACVHVLLCHVLPVTQVQLLYALLVLLLVDLPHGSVSRPPVDCYCMPFEMLVLLQHVVLS